MANLLGQDSSVPSSPLPLLCHLPRGQRSHRDPGCRSRTEETRILARTVSGGGDDRLGIPMSRDGERFRYANPVVVLVADKLAA